VDGASAGSLEFDGDAWIWEIDAAVLARRWGLAPGEGRLRLTVGLGGHTEFIDVALDGYCGGDGLPASARPLAWSRDPWPNPFNPLVQARITLAQPATVEAGVYDLRGRLVATILAGALGSGEHHLRWDGTTDGRPAEAGLYVLRVTTPQTVLSRKLMLLK